MKFNKKRNMVILTSALVLSATVMVNSTYAQQATKTLKAIYNNIKIVYNGITITSNTNAEAFTIDGTTYVPLRMAGEALGKTVQWDSANKQIMFTDKEGPTENNIVATVNGVVITKDKLYNEMVTLGGAQTLDSLITTVLVDQAATKKNITVTDEDLTKEINKLKKNYSTEAEFNAALTQSGMSLNNLKNELNMQVKINKLVEPQVKVTTADIKKYFVENPGVYDTEEEVRASHILVATKEEAKNILKELQGGADFATLATAKSLDTGSKIKGGDLGFFARGTMVDTFEKAAFALNKGKLSDIIESSFGFHIIKVTDRKDAHKATFEEASAEIKEALVSQQIATLSSTWLAELKEKSNITNTLIR
ncbi:peptidylprolyl isomerase [Paenibacillus antarcticus]|uniref:peptidylprolyl isomerase n=1 Tax=Paenibacillus antarcticus TaxID=253703 RepID=A0A168QY17_9BACL|nr:peptidylprolyl isomerase [Paenibacillus antarcticus]OAB48349.1 hypothetical protein PBAT_01550 [Paenibacillus antarcticus]